MQTEKFPYKRLLFKIANIVIVPWSLKPKHQIKYFYDGFIQSATYKIINFNSWS